MRYLAVLLLILFIGYSCNPVKKVLNDPIKMNEVATEMIRRGYCSNDTTIVTQVTDTFFIKTEENLDTLLVGANTCSFDTTLKSGTRIKYEGGLLLIKEKIVLKTKVITRTVDNYIRDTKIEQILKNDIEQYKDTLIQLNTTIKGYDKQIEQLNSKLSKVNWYLIAALVFIGASILFRVYKAFR
jgi:hypothetical protein